MSNITTRSKAKTADKRSLDDSEIVKEVYSVDKDIQNNTINEEFNRPNKIRNIETLDNTEAMEIEFEKNSSSSQSSVSHDLNKGSTSEPMETDKENITPLSDQHNNSNPNKGKATETLQIEQIDYNDSETQNSATESFSVFIAKDQFPNEGNNFEIRKKIRDAFSNHINDINKINWEKHQYLTVFIIEFSRKEIFEKYVSKRHLILNAIIHPYDSSNIEAYIQRDVENQAKNSVKLIDVPIFYETEALLKNIINITGKEIKNFHSNEKKLIQKFEFEMKRYRNNNQGRRNGRFAPKLPQYKTVYIEFKTAAGAKYLMDKGWSLDIEDFNIRILPTNNNHEAYLKRTSKGYKITGLPNNTNVKDMTKIITLINGETCSIPKAKTRFCSKIAYVMVDPKNFEDKIKKITAFNTSLYIIPLDNNVKTCIQCGSPEHMIQECNSEHTISPNGQKFFKPINIPRNTAKIVVSKSISENYGSLMKINEDFNRQKISKTSTKPNQPTNRNSNQQQQWAQRQMIYNNQPISPTRPRQNINNQPNNNNNNNDCNSTQISLDIATLNDKMKWAEKMIKDLEKQVDDQKKEIEQLKVFAKEVSAHNNYVKESMDKMVNFQQTMSERDIVKDAQLKEILNAVRGQSHHQPQEYHHQEEQLQIQYIPEQNLNPQMQSNQPRRNSKEGRISPSYQQYNTPQHKIYQFNNYNQEHHEMINSEYYNANSQSNEGWDENYGSSSSLHTPSSASYNNETEDISQEERLSQYGNEYNNHDQDNDVSSQEQSKGFTGYIKSLVR
ncbi:uncharacterized protein OCT59_023844 [Rhizophagus irregularis]|uniref:CCHC-type domain-containing protein n=3 Tax=Rhizophagus irregularis TaxID=588596 RepID=A0A015JDY3_RHIIW|nr:hypothetical protein RirG_135490 [Rhizophagus irregularis DAOM 197198w]EXX65207.1 hypothetical protein RirG_135480 [Rhizophagus irregularis DAOM 197198w]UZO03437.1 hypothetical protein OCT59_023844 [Rhizophagus irregularis]GBC20880.1 hypothetical protein GLOIN_2v1847066 [Rhizophagus irregularis DAOM 181602=DAOM 197198]